MARLSAAYYLNELAQLVKIMNRKGSSARLVISTGWPVKLAHELDRKLTKESASTKK